MTQLEKTYRHEYACPIDIEWQTSEIKEKPNNSDAMYFFKSITLQTQAIGILPSVSLRIQAKSEGNSWLVFNQDPSAKHRLVAPELIVQTNFDLDEHQLQMVCKQILDGKYEVKDISFWPDPNKDKQDDVIDKILKDIGDEYWKKFWSPTRNVLKLENITFVSSRLDGKNSISAQKLENLSCYLNIKTSEWAKAPLYVQGRPTYAETVALLSDSDLWYQAEVGILYSCNPFDKDGDEYGATVEYDREIMIGEMADPNTHPWLASIFMGETNFGDCRFATLHEAVKYANEALLNIEGFNVAQERLKQTLKSTEHEAESVAFVKSKLEMLPSKDNGAPPKSLFGYSNETLYMQFEYDWLTDTTAWYSSSSMMPAQSDNARFGSIGAAVADALANDICFASAVKERMEREQIERSMLFDELPTTKEKEISEFARKAANVVSAAGKYNPVLLAARYEKMLLNGEELSVAQEIGSLFIDEYEPSEVLQLASMSAHLKEIHKSKQKPAAPEKMNKEQNRHQVDKGYTPTHACVAHVERTAASLRARR